MVNSKRHAWRSLGTLLLLAALWGGVISGARAQQVHEESLEQATGINTIHYAQMELQITAHNEQLLKQMERQAAAARFRNGVGGAILLAGLIFFIVRSRKAKGSVKNSVPADLPTQP